MAFPYASHVTWDPGVDPVSESQYAEVQKKVFPDAWPSAADGFHWSLKARHIIFSHTNDGVAYFNNGVMTKPNDCGSGGTNLGGTGTELNAISNITKVGKFAGLGV